MNSDSHTVAYNKATSFQGASSNGRIFRKITVAFININFYKMFSIYKKNIPHKIATNNYPTNLRLYTRYLRQ